MPDLLMPAAPAGEAVSSPLARIRGTRVLIGLGWLSVPFFPLFCLFVMDYMNFGGHLTVQFTFWERHPRSALFEVVVVLLLFAVLTLILRRLWISGLIFGLLSLIAAYVNYTKAALNGDHLYPQDLAMVTQAKELTSFISGDTPVWFWLGVAAVLLWVGWFWLFRIALLRPFFWRWSTAALIILAVYLSVNTTTKTERVLNRFGMSTIDSALQSSNYAANGFVGAFTINVLSMQVQPPAGYSQDTIQSILEPYQAVAADPDAQAFDVVVVLSESFFDPRILPGVSFSENPLDNYDRLLDDPNSYSGLIYTTALGGGTVRPEFALLTGLTTDYMPDVTTPYWYVDHAFPTYVSNYKDAGYTTLAVHPYDKKFYARNTAYPLLGFDEFYGQEEVAELVEPTYKRSYISDDTTFQAIQTLVDSQEDPVFLFAITMENHQPFNALDAEDIHIQVDCPAMSEASLTALTTYTQGLYDADQMLGSLADWIDSREKPTVLLFFGDHLPTLGSNFSAYDETGFVDINGEQTTEDRQLLYSTPFIIYSNRELEGGLLEEHTGNQISDYNLLNSLARSTGMARTPYMELLADFYQNVPFYNNRLLLPLSQEDTFFPQAMEQITYDRVLGEGWSN